MLTIATTELTPRRLRTALATATRSGLLDLPIGARIAIAIHRAPLRGVDLHLIGLPERWAYRRPLVTGSGNTDHREPTDDLAALLAQLNRLTGPWRSSGITVRVLVHHDALTHR